MQTFRQYLAESNAKERAIEVGMGELIEPNDAAARSTGRRLKQSNRAGLARPDTSVYKAGTVGLDTDGNVVASTGVNSGGFQASTGVDDDPSGFAPSGGTPDGVEIDLSDPSIQLGVPDADPNLFNPSGGTPDEDYIDLSLFDREEQIPESDPNGFTGIQSEDPYALRPFEGVEDEDKD